MARVISSELRALGVESCQPDPSTRSGGERRFAGGVGAKKVDVSFATEEAGLIFAISIKGIYFPDAATASRAGRAFGKNLINRKGDMLAEATTLHKRFPYAVLGGLFLFDRGASLDNPAKNKSTYHRAHRAFRHFSDRLSHGDADEKFEAFALGLIGREPSCELSFVGSPESEIQLEDFLHAILKRTAERNSDHFDFDGKRLLRV